MPPDPDVIAALRKAVAADQGNRALRLHLAGLLVEAGELADALEQFAAILARDPADLEALRGASDAAAQTGDESRAAGYKRLADALGGGAPTPPTESEQSADERFLEIVGDQFGPEPVRVGATEEFDRGDWEVERPAVGLDDVAGMEAVKRRLHLSFLGPLRNPEIMKQYGKSLRGGLLLYGPPGCGKTFIARATAGELGSRFIAVGLSDVLDMWLGESERKLHETFELARRNAPCVLFFDEIDALGQKRSHLRHSAGRGIVNQLLAEMDGVSADNQGVFMLAATNHLWDVDTALRRPQRFDRVVLVLPPDEPARAAILLFHMRERPAGVIDLARLAARTDGFSGADLAYLCEAASEMAMEESLVSGTVRPITMGDFEEALREVRPSTRPWFETARNFAMFSNEGGVYDDLLDYIRTKRL